MRVPAAILSACAVLLAGCSDDEEPVRSVAVRPGATVRMSAEEYRFDPGRILVRAHGRAARLRIVLANRGSLAHNIHVRDSGEDLADTSSFQAGGERAVEVRLSPGSYDFRCTVGDHDELGMTGRIEVR